MRDFLATIASGMTMLFIYFLVNFILAAARNSKATQERVVVLPKLFFVIGLIGGGFFLIPIVVLLHNNDSSWEIVLFLFFFLLAASICVAYLNCRITYDEDHFTAKNFWGFKRSYRYQDITLIEGQTTVKIHIGKRIVRIDEFATGKDQFLLFARTQYKKYYKNKNVSKTIPADSPELVRKRKRSLFLGHVENPGKFIFVYLLIYALLIGSLVFGIVDSTPKSPEDFEYRSIVVDQYELDRNRLILYPAGSADKYRIVGYDKVLADADRFLELCANAERFSVGFCRNALHSKSAPYSIEHIIGADGTVYLTPEAVYQYRFGSVGQIGLIAVLGGMILLWTVFVVFSIRVGRHPERYSKKTIGLFFRSDYIHN